MFRHQILITVMTSLIATAAWAQEAEEKSPWSHESEVSLVNVEGNTEGEISSLKQKTEYKIDVHAVAFTGRYIRVKTNDVETARAWDAFGRYERAISEIWSAFLGHGAESDVYSGYIQRDHSDLGGKYFITKTDATNFFLEAGYRYTKTYPIVGDIMYSNGARLYSEVSHKASPTVSYKLWVEYLPNFDVSEAYLMNAEPSLNVMLSQIFSLKTSYLVKYKNQVLAPGEVRTDSTFTTSLVAKF